MRTLQGKRRLMLELRALSAQRASLEALLKHPDTRVRTLAQGALYQREDGRDLPLIASPLDDSVATFPDLHGTASSGGGSRLSDFESGQMVARVARAMLRPYLSAAGFGMSEDYAKLKPAKFAELCRTAFQTYWARRRERSRCARWLMVKLMRATRQTSSAHPEYHEDTQRVLAEINALPAVERAWTMFFDHQG